MSDDTFSRQVWCLLYKTCVFKVIIDLAFSITERVCERDRKEVGERLREWDRHEKQNCKRFIL